MPFTRRNAERYVIFFAKRGPHVEYNVDALLLKSKDLAHQLILAVTQSLSTSTDAQHSIDALSAGRVIETVDTLDDRRRLYTACLQRLLEAAPETGTFEDMRRSVRALNPASYATVPRYLDAVLAKSHEHWLQIESEEVARSTFNNAILGSLRRWPMLLERFTSLLAAAQPNIRKATHRELTTALLAAEQFLLNICPDEYAAARLAAQSKPRASGSSSAAPTTTPAGSGRPSRPPARAQGFVAQGSGSATNDDEPINFYNSADARRACGHCGGFLDAANCDAQGAHICGAKIWATPSALEFLRRLHFREGIKSWGWPPGATTAQPTPLPLSSNQRGSSDQQGQQNDRRRQPRSRRSGGANPTANAAAAAAPSSGPSEPAAAAGTLGGFEPHQLNALVAAANFLSTQPRGTDSFVDSAPQAMVSFDLGGPASTAYSARERLDESAMTYSVGWIPGTSGRRSQVFAEDSMANGNYVDQAFARQLHADGAVYYSRDEFSELHGVGTTTGGRPNRIHGLIAFSIIRPTGVRQEVLARVADDTHGLVLLGAPLQKAYHYLIDAARSRITIQRPHLRLELQPRPRLVGPDHQAAALPMPTYPTQRHARHALIEFERLIRGDTVSHPDFAPRPGAHADNAAAPTPRPTSTTAATISPSTAPSASSTPTATPPSSTSSADQTASPPAAAPIATPSATPPATAPIATPSATASSTPSTTSTATVARCNGKKACFVSDLILTLSDQTDPSH